MRLGEDRWRDSVGDVGEVIKDGEDEFKWWVGREQAP